MREVEKEDITCHDIITSEDYVDIYQRIKGDIDEAAAEAGAECAQRVFEEWVILHIKMDQKDCDRFYLNSEYIVLPNLYGLTSVSSIEAAGIGPVLSSESLDISGKGVLIAIVDTGIDYIHEAFRYEDNTSKILSIWDQTQAGTPPAGFLYGSEYSNEQINEALNSEDPLSVVPTVDDVGHGTFLAGVAAGRSNLEENFSGAAPDAELIVVKLKRAKKCLSDFFQVKEGAIVFQTNDILQGFNYVLEKAQQKDKPLVLLFAGASSDGPHNGANEVEEFLAKKGDAIGVIVVTSAGNEANAAHHFSGTFKEGESQVNLDLNIADGEKGVFVNMWVPLPDVLSLELISPSGETTGVFPIKPREWQFKTFPLENTVIRVHYDLLEERSAEESIAFMIINPLPGIWNIIIHGETLVNRKFDIYLPIRSFIDRLTIFLKPDPYTTVVIPSTNPGTITVGAYNEIISSIYLESGRGFTREDRVKPDFVAPGVNIIGPYPNNTYGMLSGTSLSAAITAGACALLLEWGIIKGNDPAINTVAMKTYLARGARRREGVIYPNKEWGFGELDLINTFTKI
ncbi:S8 family peptidase [Vallitalea okinawensis]|uniref:S8 family peptidase n=1 Tax=Vallitalea okinawensis TaxID=2078660 RepID=UPI000CFC209A|nr:S8 family peptidase [Vallitalea okinawensis]